MGDHQGVLTLIGLGSNRRHGRHGVPEAVLRAAVRALADAGLPLDQLSRLHATAPMGPGGRRFANAVLRTRWTGSAIDLLHLIKRIEQQFGRRPSRRWGDRVLDLDLLALGQMRVSGPGLTLPHPGLPHRRFVLDPLVEVAPGWRHPGINATARQLRARLLRSRPAVRTV
ncbi:2-amino-4-hydroxy-6-hydroxymethyldihydropteridine diphosphokinase [Polymorphobacter sp.]|uniref:2-amino-4-hydroxy-6- hydroxymethyldihydropteridine diphosphokinase n=1 Tax=Polymorphobacter sp. TaxID=1909290 RepID=UPI003F70CAED